MTHIAINPDGIMAFPGITQVMISTGSRHVHLSGQAPVNSAGELQGEGDLGQQVVATLRNLVVCLTAAGAGIDDVVKLTYYVVDFDESSLAALAGALGEVFGEHGPEPAATLIGVTTLFMPGQLIEIDAVAILD